MELSRIVSGETPETPLLRCARLFYSPSVRVGSKVVPSLRGGRCAGPVDFRDLIRRKIPIFGRICQSFVNELSPFPSKLLGAQAKGLTLSEITMTLHC